jgi:Domain of unknown function (DUF4261)
MSVLRRLFRREKPQSVAHQALVMVLLADGESFSGTATLDYLAAHWTDLPSVAGRDAQDAVTVASIPGGMIGLLHVPMPVPARDLEGPVAVAWHWPEAAQLVPAHRAHVIVTAGSTTLDAVDVRILLTKLAASVLAVSEGVGVYVGDAMLVRSAADYLSDASEASRNNLPLLSWVGFNPVHEDGRLSAYTTGLTAFGLLELEVRGSAMTTPELFGTLADLASYQLSTGKVLRDGDTFGASESDRTRVRYGPSAFIPETTVAALELP